MNSEVSSRGSDRTAKKPYAKPSLRVYGNMGEITRSVAASTVGDNPGSTNNHKTT